MHKKKNQLSRRDFIKGTGSAAIAAGAGLRLDSAHAASNQKHNILLIVTDQERYMPASELPAGYSLPAHEKLASNGVVFENHQGVLSRLPNFAASIQKRRKGSACQVPPSQDRGGFHGAEGNMPTVWVSVG